jgi:Holliday junction resolvase RusA-like endonuclease
VTRLEFFADGDPVPQGSTRAFARNGRVVTTNDPSGRLERWRGDIRSAAKPILPPGFDCLEGPVAISVDFAFARPRSHYLPVTKSRPVAVLRPDAPVWHSQKPDVDRLLRAVLDALTAVVWRDDSQVASVGHLSKRWAAHAGASIVVTEVVE